MVGIWVFHYLEQLFTFLGLINVYHLKLNSVLLFGFRDKSQFMLRRIFDELVLENE